MFAVAAALLAVLAAALIGYAAYQVGRAIADARQVLAAGDFEYIIIDSVGYVVIAIAILDVTKHIFEEEVSGPHHRAGEGMFQKSFFKFLSIISIAVFLEGLVLVAEFAIMTFTGLYIRCSFSSCRGHDGRAGAGAMARRQREGTTRRSGGLRAP